MRPLSHRTTLVIDPPADDEVEVCLLGRGRGESIVVHLLDGRWMIVDSFNRRREEPAALWYLRSLGVEPDQVEIIVVTHFHADHHLGIDRLHDRCRSARLFTTGAMGKEQFRKVRGSADAAPVLGALAATIERAKDRVLADGAAGHLPAQVGQLVADVGGSVVRALSPTSRAMVASDQELGVALTIGWDAVESQLRDDNRCSVVLHLDLRGVNALLCADLPRHPKYGWAAVLGDPLHGGLTRVDLVKAGHHGSVTAHDDAMWARLVDPEPVICVAPYSSSRLPGPADVERLRGQCGELWQAAPSDGQWITEDGMSISVKGQTGFIRSRRRVDEPAWRTHAVEPGRKLHPESFSV